MSQRDNSTKSKKFEHLTYSKRAQIEVLLKAKIAKKKRKYRRNFQLNISQTVELVGAAYSQMKPFVSLRTIYNYLCIKNISRRKTNKPTRNHTHLGRSIEVFQ